MALRSTRVADGGVRGGGGRVSRTPVLALLGAGVFALALVNRALPVVRGAGLSGVLGYDDGVYHAAAVGLVHGRLPYRDFLLLHPPGVLVALAPVAAFGRAVGEVAGWEASRLLWMVLGACTSVLVMLILLPVGRLAAAAGGSFYAMFPGAVLVERTTMLEGLANLCLALALVLVLRLGSSDLVPRVSTGRRWMVPAGAGALLGFGATVKIWGVVPLTVVCLGAVVAVGVRLGLLIFLGAAAAAVVVCLPFFLAAPVEMWQMVILDQFGRARSDGVVERAAEVMTMGRMPGGGAGLAAAAVAIGAVVAGCLAAWQVRSIRVAVVLLATMIALLLIAPVFYPHFIGALAVPLAVVAGAAVSCLQRWFGSRRLWRLAGLAVVAVGLALDMVAMSRIRSGDVVPPVLGSVVQPAPGCVTADDPNSLLALGVVGRNVGRGCVLVVDLGGYSHDLSRGSGVSRARNLAWQQLSLSYLGGGHLTVLSRLGDGRWFSARTDAQIERWPLRMRAGGYEVREPGP